MRTFFDTNVLVYAHDLANAIKRDVSRSLVAEALEGGDFIVSTQVLAEFYSTATRRRLLSGSEALELLAVWSGHEVVSQTPDLVVRAIGLHEHHSLSFWDGLIVQAALDARCDVLLSEDMQHGKHFGELEIRNPFIATGAHEPRAPYRAGRPVGRRRVARSLRSA